MVCDNGRVGYFCDGTPCYTDKDCFNGKCNMYARCEPRILFDAQKHANEITADKDDYIKNKLDKGNSTGAKNETEPISAAKIPNDSKALQEKHFEDSPFSDKSQLNSFLMVFGAVASVLAMIFLISCIREVNTEESDNNNAQTDQQA